MPIASGIATETCLRHPNMLVACPPASKERSSTRVDVVVHPSTHQIIGPSCESAALPGPDVRLTVDGRLVSHAAITCNDPLTVAIRPAEAKPGAPAAPPPLPTSIQRRPSLIRLKVAASMLAVRFMVRAQRLASDVA